MIPVKHLLIIEGSARTPRFLKSPTFPLWQRRMKGDFGFLCEFNVLGATRNPRKKSVTKIFWVTCPQCKGEFYCHYQELRHKKIKLLCPFCSHQFLDEESPKIVE
jgi:hypothetical protein